jgi:hypothetical protein
MGKRFPDESQERHGICSRTFHDPVQGWSGCQGMLLYIDDSIGAMLKKSTDGSVIAFIHWWGGRGGGSCVPRTCFSEDRNECDGCGLNDCCSNGPNLLMNFVVPKDKETLWGVCRGRE